MEKESVRITQANGEIHLSFSTLLSIAQARVLQARLGEVLATPSRLVLDAGQVAQVDTAAMQVLAGFCRHRREQGAPLRWQAISPALQEAARLLGLDSLFGVPV